MPPTPPGRSRHADADTRQRKEIVCEEMEGDNGTVPVLQRLMDDHDVVQELPLATCGRRYRVEVRA